MKKLNFNIQRFDEEAGFNPAQYNSFVYRFDGATPTINRALANNQDVLRVLKSAAGSPRLSSDTKEIIQALNQAIDGTVDYFDSVKNWASGVVSNLSGLLGVGGLSSISSSIDRTVLDAIDEEFANGMVGLRGYADADTCIQGLADVTNTMKSGLENVTDSVISADNSLPAKVHQALGGTISTNNDDILNAYSKLNEYLSTYMEQFKSQLQNVIDDMASAAGSK